MERTEEALRERVRETPLSERLKTCEKYIASMCAERRPPKMTIPLQHYDEDFYIYTTLADAQATIAVLTEALECTLLEKPLPNGEYVHHVACSGDRRKPAGTVGISCSCRVGKATIAALQAQVQELEEITKVICGHCCEPMEIPSKAVLQSALTQRTAELEAAKELGVHLSHCNFGENVDVCKYGQDNCPALSEGWACLGRALVQRANLQDELERVRGELAEMRERKDGAYLERNRVVAALASCFPSGISRTAIEGWHDDWHGCVYIDLPTGQVSWHYHDSHAHLFAHLPPYTKQWDGHTTEEKYERVALLQHRQGMEGQS